MRYTRYCLIIVLTLLFISHRATAQSKDYDTYQGEGFTMQYPSEWRVDESGTMGAKVIFFSPAESEDDKFSENINVMVQDLSGHPMTLKEYTDLSVSQIKTLATNGNLVESKTIHTTTGEAQKLIYTADQGVYHLKFQQLYYIVNDKAYLITYTAEEDKFQKFLPKAESVLKSFAQK